MTRKVMDFVLVTSMQYYATKKYYGLFLQKFLRSIIKKIIWKSARDVMVFQILKVT